MENISLEKQPLRILFLASDPSNAARLHLGRELQAVRNKLASNQYFEIKDHQAVKADDVLQTITSYKPHIVHFSGHGIDTGELCFEDELGNAKVVPPEALASIFSLVTEYVKCVIVNTCYAEKQAKAIVQYVPVVIGTKKEISDNAAIKFSTGFYTALDPDLTQDNLNTAFKRGCIAIQLDGNLQEHLTPILIFGSPEVRFSSEVDSTLSTISNPNAPVVRMLIRGLTLKGIGMGLSPNIVDEIVNDKMQRLKDYNNNIIEYENNLIEALRDEFPLSEATLSALQFLQNGLGLRNDDVISIQTKILSNPKLDSAYNWYDRGRGQFDLKNFEKAIEYYSKAIEKNQEYSGAYFEKGYSHANLQQYESAIEAFSKAIEINKNWEVMSSLSSAYFNRGHAYYSTQPQQKECMLMALEDWSKSIDLNPDPSSYYNRGLANEYLRYFDKAIADYKKSLEIDSNSNTIPDSKAKTVTITRIIKCYAEIGNQDEIDKWTKVALDLYRNSDPLGSIDDNLDDERN